METEKLIWYLFHMCFPQAIGHGVKVSFTSSLSGYAKVLAHNLNDIRN